MSVLFAILCLMLIAGAAGAVLLRQPIHCALAAAVAFVSVALLYLELGAQFAGLAQILVYVGAVAILIVFAILLTRAGDVGKEPAWSSAGLIGLGAAILVGGGLLISQFHSAGLARLMEASASGSATSTVHELGVQLMTRYVLPLQAIALLLTAAMIGAVLLAMHERRTKR